MSMLVCCEEVLMENKKRSLSCQILVSDFFKSPSRSRASPLVFLEVGDDDPDDPPILQKEISPP
jgi:hypothetical protein